MTRERIRAINKNSSCIHHLSIENIKNYKITRNTKITSIFHNNPLSPTEDKNKFWIVKIKIFDLNEYCKLYFDNRGTVSDALLLLSNYLRPKLKDSNFSWYFTTNKNQILQEHYPLFYYVTE